MKHQLTDPRWIYYIFLILMFFAILLQVAFYRPPSFRQLHGNDRTRMQEVKRIDVVGAFLLVAGLTLFLLGVSWGEKIEALVGKDLVAELYIGGLPLPWSSARILGLLITGGILIIIFIFWGTSLTISIRCRYLLRNRDLCKDSQSTSANALLQGRPRIRLPSRHRVGIRRDVCRSEYHLAFTYGFRSCQVSHQQLTPRRGRSYLRRSGHELAGECMAFGEQLLLHVLIVR